MRFRLIMSYLLLVFIGFSNIAQGAETWVVNPTKIPTFDQNEQKRFTEAMKRYNIDVAYDPTLKKEPLDLIKKKAQTLIPLVQDKGMVVCQVRPGLENLHIGIIVNDLAHLKGGELQNFRKMIENVAMVFQEMGYGDYLASCDFGKSYLSSDGHKITGDCWEMIAMGQGYVTRKDGIYKLAPKIWRQNYTLFNKTPHFKKENANLIKQFAGRLQAHIKGTASKPSFFCKPTLPWNFTIIDFPETEKVSVDRMLVRLKEIGAVHVKKGGAIVCSKIPREDKMPTSQQKELSKCTFCKESVLQLQEMIKTDKTTVLYINEPYTIRAHFMILPLKHEESLQCLPEATFDEVMMWAQKLNTILGDQKNTIWFCQNGPRAGQTVPHTHLHVVRRPNSVTPEIKVLNALAGEKSKPVSPQEYEKMRQWILEKLRK